jgi:hypothetical protein
MIVTLKKLPGLDGANRFPASFAVQATAPS